MAADSRPARVCSRRGRGVTTWRPTTDEAASRPKSKSTASRPLPSALSLILAILALGSPGQVEAHAGCGYGHEKGLQAQRRVHSEFQAKRELTARVATDGGERAAGRADEALIRGDQLSSARPIRIHVLYQLPDEVTTPQLTEEVRSYLEDRLVPTSVTEVARRLLLKRPTVGNFLIPRLCASEATYSDGSASGRCAAYQPIQELCSFPELGVETDPSLYGPATAYECFAPGEACLPTAVDSGGEGLPDTDFVLYVTAKNVECSGDTLAYAGHCELDPTTGRPLAGYVNFCPTSIRLESCKHATQLATGVHEILHALYFTSDLFPFFIDGNGQQLGIENVLQNGSVVSPAVVESAREHFQCSALDGVPLEDAGGGGTVGSHWEARYMNTELMTGSSSDLRLASWSSMTSALAEDSGWFLPNNGADGYLDWGNSAGCSFFNLTCAEYAEQNPWQPYFCSAAQLADDAPDRFCELDGLASVKCEVDSLIGEECPVRTRFLWQGDPPDPEVCQARDSRCTFRYNEALDISPAYGLRWGPDSRCLAFSEALAQPGNILNWPAENSPDCFETDCENGQLYVTLPNSATGIDARILCPEGGTLDARDAGYVSGVFDCPSNVTDYCESLACPNSCSNNGWCVSGSCVCSLGFLGEDCSESVCNAESCAPGFVCDLIIGGCVEEPDIPTPGPTPTPGEVTTPLPAGPSTTTPTMTSLNSPTPQDSTSTPTPEATGTATLEPTRTVPAPDVITSTPQATATTTPMETNTTPSATGTPTPTETADTPPAAGTPTPVQTSPPDAAPTPTSTPISEVYSVRSIVRLAALDTVTFTPVLQLAFRATIADTINANVNTGMLNMTEQEVAIASVTNGSVVVESIVSNPPVSPLSDSDTANSIKAALTAGLDDRGAFNARLAANGFPAAAVLEEVPRQPYVEVDGVAVPTPSPKPSWDSDEWWHRLHDEIQEKPWIIGIIVAAIVLVIICVVGLYCVVRKCVARSRANRPEPVTPSSLTVDKTPKQMSVDVHVSPAGLHYSKGFDESCPIPRPPPPAASFPPWSSSYTPGWASPYGVTPPGMVNFSASPKPSTSAIRLHFSPGRPRVERFDHVVLCPSLSDNQVEGLQRAVREDVALVCYDYYSFTLPELLGHVKYALYGPAKPLRSIAFLSWFIPSPGTVDIVQGFGLSAPLLRDPAGTETLAFWQQLCGFLDDNGRISFLGANLTKVPERGAPLIRMLQECTRVVHTASDDMRRGFPLQVLSSDGRSLEETTVIALDDYFHADVFHAHFHGFR